MTLFTVIANEDSNSWIYRVYDAPEGAIRTTDDIVAEGNAKTHGLAIEGAQQARREYQDNS